jgi:hypothetical protein
MDCLIKLGRDVQIIVKAAPRSRSNGRLLVIFAQVEPNTTRRRLSHYCNHEVVA